MLLTGNDADGGGVAREVDDDGGEVVFWARRGEDDVQLGAADMKVALESIDDSWNGDYTQLEQLPAPAIFSWARSARFGCKKIKKGVR